MADIDNVFKEIAKSLKKEGLQFHFRSSRAAGYNTPELSIQKGYRRIAIRAVLVTSGLRSTTQVLEVQGRSAHASENHHYLIFSPPGKTGQENGYTIQFHARAKRETVADIMGALKCARSWLEFEYGHAPWCHSCPYQIHCLTREV